MSSAVQKIITPGGETLVVVPLAEYEALLDAADVAAAERIVADIAAGREELIPAAIVDRFLDGENPIRVWREYRGLSATDLAAKVEISAGYLSELETGKKAGGIDTLRRLAAALNLDIDDLVS
jgi:predicted transcriptional regulator